MRRLPALLTIAAGLSLPMPAALAQQQPPAGFATQGYTPPDFQMPEGSGCAGDIARWQAIQGNDYSGGNIGLKVYNQIQNEIAQAVTLCQEGKDAQARKLIAASRSRHGYPQ